MSGWSVFPGLLFKRSSHSAPSDIVNSFIYLFFSFLYRASQKLLHRLSNMDLNTGQKFPLLSQGPGVGPLIYLSRLPACVIQYWWLPYTKWLKESACSSAVWELHFLSLPKLSLLSYIFYTALCLWLYLFSFLPLSLFLLVCFYYFNTFASEIAATMSHEVFNRHGAIHDSGCNVKKKKNHLKLFPRISAIFFFTIQQEDNN